VFDIAREIETALCDFRAAARALLDQDGPDRRRSDAQAPEQPDLTGEAGVGKTAVVEGFAQRIAAGDVPLSLRRVKLYVLDVGLLQAGASMKGEFEQRLRSVIDEVPSSPTPIILFIDEAHTLIGAGGAARMSDAANLLKPALARGTLKTIAATTWAEYRQYFEKDPALSRRFQPIYVSEPTSPRPR
jgi:type VI secretion system protein VasG